MLKTAQIYLLVGFFGSGKTTLIRALLSQESKEKYAIIQNEFAEGEMGIEQPLIMDESGTPFSSFLELPNGCICCSAKYSPLMKKRPHCGSVVYHKQHRSQTHRCGNKWTCGSSFLHQAVLVR
jgi:GTPase SAR1 family protein